MFDISGMILVFWINQVVTIVCAAAKFTIEVCSINVQLIKVYASVIG